MATARLCGVFTLSDAVSTLRAAADAAALPALGAALGFGPPLPLDRRSLARLALGDSVQRAKVAPRNDALRALFVDLCAGSPDAVATATSAVCRAIARGAPERCWLVVARDETSGVLAIAAAPSDPRATVPLHLVDPRHVRESDAETFAALVGSCEGPDVLVHLRWRETLGRTALSRRFYAELEGHVETLARSAVGPASHDVRRSIALLHVSRLLFVAFLEARGWLDGDREFLRRQFAARAGGGASAHRRLLEPL